MKTKKILSIAMLVLALASCSSKDDKKAVEVKEELPIVEITTIGAEAVKQTSEYSRRTAVRASSASWLT